MQNTIKKKRASFAGEAGLLQRISGLEAENRELRKRLAEAQETGADRLNELEQVNRVLQSSEEKSRTLFQNTPFLGFIWEFRDDGYCLADFNRAGAVMRSGIASRGLGARADDIFGHRPELVDLIRQCHTEKSRFKTEYDYVSKDTGQTRTLLVYFTWVPDDRVMVYSEDVTERKQAEQALIRSETMFRTLAETASSGIVIAAEGRMKYINRAALEIFGLPPHARGGALEKNVLDFIHPDMRDLAQSRMTGRLEGADIPRRYELKVLTSAGQTRWMDYAGSRVDYDGQPAVLGVFFDITEKHLAEEALKESERRYRQMFDANPAVKLLIDPETSTIADANAAAAFFYGYPKDMLRGKPYDDICPAGPMDLHEYLSRAVSGNLTPFDSLHRLADGDMRNVEVHAGPVTIQNRTFVNAIVRDVTEHRKNEAEVAAYQKKLRALAAELASSEEKDRRRLALELHDRVSQTLALCVARLKSMRSAASDGEMGDQISTLLELAEQTLHHSQALIFELSPPLLYDLGLEAALDWLTEYVRDLYRIPIRFTEDKRFKPVSEELKIVLYRAARELLLNVVKHSRATQADVNAWTNGRQIFISVSDNGIGLDNTDIEKSTPNGFGLFHIQQCLSPLGGRLEINSSRGEGSWITISAPLLYDTKKPRTGRSAPRPS